ncbi:unnamed protein product [Polarella glacialis]|uniref:Amino acid permease/ SLC12A domain-containing protein n=2 Tax=Polarella glacialis TaxID=89957 RepID=A0A813DGK9_POLGL|nr:unnamed protein product [Polarella glacialis]
MYLLPVLVGLTVLPDVDAWHDGSFVEIGGLIGGPFMAATIAILGIVSGFGQLNALMCSSVREIVCLAEMPCQPVPQFLGRLHPRFLTPHIGTMVFSSLLFCLVGTDFTDLVAASMFFDCFSFVLQFAAWIRYRLRTSSDDLDTSLDLGYRAPLGVTGVILLSAIPICLCILAVFLTWQEKGTECKIGFFGTFAVSTLMYWLQPAASGALASSSSAPLLAGTH